MFIKVLKLATILQLSYVIPVSTGYTDSCKSSQFQFLKSSVYNPATNTFTGNGVNFNACELPQDARIRIPGKFFTADYVETRLNVKTEGNSLFTVVKVYCG
jgi:hypothetical protein